MSTVKSVTFAFITSVNLLKPTAYVNHQV